MNIVCFGQQDWHACWVTKQQLLSRLARRGHRVLFVNPVPADREAVEEVADGLHVLTMRRHAGRIGARLARWRLRRAAERLGLWAPVAVCLWPASRWLIDAVRPRGVVYFAEDDNAGFGGLGEAFAEHQRREERRLLAECDVALAVSPTLLDRFRPIQPRSHLQENGVELDDFSPAALDAAEIPASLRGVAGPIAGFVGQIDERMDQELVAAVAGAMAGRGGVVVLAGRVKEGVDVGRLGSLANVLFTGHLDYRDLAGVYKRLDVGLVPYVRSPLTESCNPLKVYEYLAADVPTIATDLPGLNSTRGAIEVADGRPAFVAAVLRGIDYPEAKRAERSAVARGASWQARADEFESRLREAEATAGPHAEARPDRRGRVAVRVPPRLDGKDQSVRLVNDDYRTAGLSSQQEAIYLASRVVGGLYYVGRRLARLARRDRRRVVRILVVRNGHLGDTVVFFPTLAALRQRYPWAKIDVATAPRSGGASLLRDSPYVDEVLELDFFNQTRRRRIAGAWRLLRRGYDLVLGGVWYFHLPEAVFSGAPLRLGLYDGHPLQRFADRVVPLDPTLHEAENNLRLAELVTGPVPLQDRTPQLHLDEERVAEQGRRFRARLGVGPETPVVAMHPGSKRPSRRWPPEAFAELAERLLRDRPRLRVVLTGAGDDEAGLIGRIIEHVDPAVRDRVVSAHGAGSLMGLIGFLDGCRCLVCNDTGVMHVARSRGVPLVAVVGPENDRRWGPHPIGMAPATVVRQQVPGTPHGKDRCPWNLSLASIPAERVARHVEAVLGGEGLAEPVEHGGRRFYPLVRDVERLSFADLAGRGLRVPKVAVVLPADPALLGLDGPAADPPAAAWARQHYPAIDVLLVEAAAAAADRADPSRRSAASAVTVVTVAPDDPDAAWAAVLEATDAALFLPASPTATPDPWAVAQRVSAYLRGPIIEVVGPDGPVPPRRAGEIWTADLLAGGWLMTRGALVDLLRHPLPRASLPRAA